MSLRSDDSLVVLELGASIVLRPIWAQKEKAREPERVGSVSS